MDLRTKRGRATRSFFLVVMIIGAILGCIMGIDASVRAIAQGENGIAVALLILCVLCFVFLIGIMIGMLKRGQGGNL